MKSRMILISISILLLSTIILQEPISYIVSAQGTEIIYDMNPDIDCLHLISDTNFTQEPNHGVNGTTGEFSSSYSSDIETNIYNYVELKWEHSPGGLLELRNNISIGDHEPDSWDYSYFTFPFEWPYESLPTSCLSVLELEVECTGDFAQGILGQSFFEVCVMLIDSGGKFSRLQSQEFLHNEPYSYYSNQLSSWIIEYGWGSMIEDETGYQEAPTDFAELTIALAPAAHFFWGSEPAIDTYEGSVTVRCKYADIQVLVDIPPITNPVYPTAIGFASSNRSVAYVGMAASPNKSIFTMGKTNTVPNRGVIVKWDNDAQPEWIQEWRDDAPSAIAATNALLYTVGQQEENLSLAVWTHQGELIETRLFDFSDTDCGKDICVLESGEIFILGYSHNVLGYLTFLLKLHQDYSIEWQLYAAPSSYLPEYGLEVTEDGVSYMQIGTNIGRVTSNGSVSGTDLQISIENFKVTSDGYIWRSGVNSGYTSPINSRRRDLAISKLLFPSLETNITTTVRYRYSPLFYDSTWHSSIAIDNDEESVYVLSQKGASFLQSIIIKVSQDCTINWCTSIQDGPGGTYPEDWYLWYDLEVLETDLICVAGSDFPGIEMKLTFAIFDFRDFSVVPIDWVLVGIIGGAVVIADIAIIYYMKRRKESRQKGSDDLREVFDDLL